jgi:hypothetical protein
MNVEIYDKDGTFASITAHVLNTQTSPRLGKLRVSTLLMRLRLATIAVEKEWLMFDERDLKKLLLWIDDRFPLPDGAGGHSTAIASH